MMNQFYMLTVSEALAYDSSNFTHSISVNVTNPNDVEQMFDSISYAKGASIIRMVQTWLDAKSSDRSGSGEDDGPDATTTTTYFQRGLKRYLTKYAYGNAERVDLWRSLEEEAVENGWLEKGSVETMMTTWTDYAGYPVVVVAADETGAQTSTIHLRQERFFSKINGSSSRTASPNWTIPLTFGVLNSPDRRGSPWTSQILFSSASTKIDVPASFMTQSESPLQADSTGCDNLLKLNIGQYGFYRVQYTDTLLRRLVGCLKQDQSWMPNQDLAGFVDDTFQLALAGRYSVDAALDLFPVVSQQDGMDHGFTRCLELIPVDYVVWETGLHFMEHFAYLFELQIFHGAFVQYALTQIRPKLDRIGWGLSSRDADAHTSHLLRGRIIGLALYFGDQVCEIRVDDWTV